jgi:hypothetical protein
MKTNGFTRIVCSALLGLASVSALSAILGPSELAASDAQRTATDSLGAAQAAGKNQGSRAIDLLIDLQPNKPGIGFNARQGSAGVGVATSPAREPLVEDQANRPPAVPTNATGLFGTQATPPVLREPSPGATQNTRIPTAAEMAGDKAVANYRGEAPWWMTPRGWIAMLKEHREWIAAILVAVFLGWVGVSLTSRRWR